MRYLIVYLQFGTPEEHAGEDQYGHDAEDADVPGCQQRSSRLCDAY